MDMTVFELQKRIEEILKAGGCETPAFDAVCLLEDIGKIGRGRVSSSRSLSVPLEHETAVLNAAVRRAAGEPLQYLLGTWDFLGLTLDVGEGVLVPRPETELLCELSAECLQSFPNKNVYDLCAGSGCVGLGSGNRSGTLRCFEGIPGFSQFHRCGSQPGPCQPADGLQ